MKIIQEPRIHVGLDTVIADAPISYVYSSREEGIQDAYVLIALETKRGDKHRYAVRLTLDDARKIAEDLAQWVRYYDSESLVDERDYLVGEGY
jgi:hypothetical protein